MLNDILAYAEDVPYNVQLLAHTCWNELRALADKEPAVIRELVLKSMMLIVRQYDPFYTQIWSTLTTIQQKTLMAVIAEDGSRLQSQKATHLIGKGACTVQRSVGALLEKEVLREEERHGGTRLRFEDPFFSQWIRAFPAKASGITLR